ncbi:MAG TPA: enoyl-CoA hydratase [Bryobacteraceae bacterium]|jgi:enoyl-CoA hydratase/carnithine racemase|nr:enoyl-CoA hydratase [Bryobacteraceae bacterium]
MEEITTELSGNVLSVQFNRPSKKNAMTLAMYAALAEELDRADKNDDVRVVVAHGAGDSFTAGNDLADFTSHPPGPGDSPQARFLDALIRFGKPLVAAVHGVAVGGGTTMLLHFDFVYAAESTKFQVPFINLALVPELASSYTLPRQIGYLQAAELILLGEPFSAARANELGLVTAVVPDQNVLAKADETAKKLAQKPAEALRACKKLIKAPDREFIDQAVHRELSEFAVRVRSAEAKDAFTAFLEKPKPDFNSAKAKAS